MNLHIFAHNGIDHATSTEAASHQSNSTLLWVGVITIAATLLIYATIKRTSKTETQPENTDEEN